MGAITGMMNVTGSLGYAASGGGGGGDGYIDFSMYSSRWTLSSVRNIQNRTATTLDYNGDGTSHFDISDLTGKRYFEFATGGGQMAIAVVDNTTDAAGTNVVAYAYPMRNAHDEHFVLNYQGSSTIQTVDFNSNALTNVATSADISGSINDSMRFLLAIDCDGGKVYFGFGSGGGEQAYWLSSATAFTTDFSSAADFSGSFDLNYIAWQIDPAGTGCLFAARDDDQVYTAPSGYSAQDESNISAATLFTGVGSHTFTVPTGVTAISAVCIGGGGSGGNDGGGASSGQGGGGGGLSYVTNYSVTPGQVLNVVVGAGGAGASGNASSGNAGGASSIKTQDNSTTICLANGGGAGLSNTSGADPNNGGSTTGAVGDVTNAGGTGGGGHSSRGAGGGGAAGYSGAGGAGANGSTTADGGAGSGGGGGGGGSCTGIQRVAAGGGGVGVYIEGSSGSGGSSTNDEDVDPTGGGGGSDGTDGERGEYTGSGFGDGGVYGGGSGGGSDETDSYSGNGGQGAVRIIYAGSDVANLAAYPDKSDRYYSETVVT